MGRVVIAHPDQSSPREFPQLAGVLTKGTILTKGVIDKPDHSLHMWSHELAPGAEIRFDAPPIDHTILVWTGELLAAGKSVKPDGTVIVEHKGSTTLRAGREGAAIAHLHQRADLDKPPKKAGGNVHISDEKGVWSHENVATHLNTYTIWADSGCPTCDIWFHRNDIYNARAQGGSHSHTEDEIIMVRRGGMLIGKRTLQPWTALAIDAGTTYSFGVAEGGMSFVNFRVSAPYYQKIMPNNKPLHAPIPEREMIRNLEWHQLMSYSAATAETYRELGYGLDDAAEPAPAKT